MIDLDAGKPVLEYRDVAQDRLQARVPPWERGAVWERFADGVVYAAVWGSALTLVLVLLGAAVLWGLLVAVAAG
jgi:hypothetical protein